MVDRSWVRVPDLQLSHGHLPLRWRRGRGGLRWLLLRGPRPPLLLPALVRDGGARFRHQKAPEGGRLGADDAAHSSFFLQGSGHHALRGADPRLGHGRRHRAGRLLRLLLARRSQGCLSGRGKALMGSCVLTSVSNGPMFLIEVNVFLRKKRHILDRFGLHPMLCVTTDLSCQSRGIPWLATLAVETGGGGGCFAAPAYYSRGTPSMPEPVRAQSSPSEVQSVPDFPTENIYNLSKRIILMRTPNKNEVGSVSYLPVELLPRKDWRVRCCSEIAYYTAMLTYGCSCWTAFFSLCLSVSKRTCRL